MVSSYALILTGEVLPGFLPDAVWPQLAAEVRIEPEQFAQLLAQTPRTIKQDDDAGKLQKLQEDIAKIGAQTEICLTDGQPALYVQVNGTPRGPVPRTLVEQRVQRGHWPETIAVAEVGAEKWHAFREYEALISPSPPLPAAPVFAAVAEFTVAPTPILPAYARDDDDDDPALAGAKYLAAGKDKILVGSESDPNTLVHQWSELPESDAIYADFWRRAAAHVYDIVRFWATSGGVSFVAAGLMFLAPPFLGAVFLLLVQFGVWFWYYPWQESGGDQATFGKRAFGIKVVDRYGGAIGLGQAVWRSLSQFLMPLVTSVFMIVYVINKAIPAVQSVKESIAANRDAWVVGNVFSSLFTSIITVFVVVQIVIALPYMMAGWTRRKQTLYDMMAGAFVVFNQVEPGQRLPRQRPPMSQSAHALITLAALKVCASAAFILVIPREMQAMGAINEAVAIKGDTLNGCRPSQRPLPNPPLDKIEIITNDMPEFCKIAVTLSDSADMPAGLRGGTIEFTQTKVGPGEWRMGCSSNLPGKYLTSLSCW